MIGKLMDAMLKIYAQEKYRPMIDDSGNMQVTYCNMAVNEMCEAIGYGDFKGMLANEMIDLMDESPDWYKVPMTMSQSCVNQGKVIIAGDKGEEHGHVVMLRPGERVYSQKWGLHVPKCFNIGKSYNINRGVNWAFKDIPNFYLFTRDID